MKLLKNKHINLGIIIATITNAIVGGFLVYNSFQGHSSFGIILGAILPLIALVLYIDSYGKYENYEITEHIVKKIFKPSIKIGITLLVLMVIIMTWTSISQNEITIDFEYLYFFTIILLIFLVPNLLVQFVFYLFLKRKFRDEDNVTD